MSALRATLDKIKSTFKRRERCTTCKGTIEITGLSGWAKHKKYCRNRAGNRADELARGDGQATTASLPGYTQPPPHFGSEASTSQSRTSTGISLLVKAKGEEEDAARRVKQRRVSLLVGATPPLPVRPNFLSKHVPRMFTYTRSHSMTRTSPILTPKHQIALPELAQHPPAASVDYLPTSSTSSPIVKVYLAHTFATNFLPQLFHNLHQHSLRPLRPMSHPTISTPKLHGGHPSIDLAFSGSIKKSLPGIRRMILGLTPSFPLHQSVLPPPQPLRNHPQGSFAPSSKSLKP